MNVRFLCRKILKNIQSAWLSEIVTVTQRQRNLCQTLTLIEERPDLHSEVFL